MKCDRILLKLSGEALAGDKHQGFSEEEVTRVAAEVKKVVDKGIEVGIVIGGGNFWRGRTSEGMDRVKADQIGMMATVMNCIYAADAFRRAGMKCRVTSPYAIGDVTEGFVRDKAIEAMESGEVVFFAGGTSHPYFSTDTGIALRAIEMEADVILLAKSIDGVYDSDPAINPDAKRYDVITMERVLDEQLKVIDLTATQMCYDNHKSLAVFDLRKENSISIAMKAFVGVDLKNEAEVKKLSESFDGTICIG